MITFEVFADEDGQWRWRAKSRNGRKLAASGESFASKRNAVRSMDLVILGVSVGEWKVAE